MATPQMTPEAASAVTLLNRLAYELSQREKVVKKRLDYYGGTHPLCYASPEFEEYFAQRFAGFADNWCAPVISGPVERMKVLGVRLDTESREIDKELARVWRSNNADLGSSEAFIIALAAGWSHALVWGNPDDDETPLITWQRPDQAIVEHDPETGRRRHGLLMWRDENKEYATLHTPEFVWKFSRHSFYNPNTRTNLILPGNTIGGWEPYQPESDDTWPIENPMGVCALIELRNHTLLDDNPISDIAGVMEMQNTINLTWAYLMNALDYASLPQRIVTGAEMPKMPVLDSDGQVIGQRPISLDTLIKERILWIPNRDAQTSEWAAANLEVFSSVIEQAIEHIAAQTRTPPHYLIGKIANISADALTAAETGLVAKTRERITYLQPGIREVHRLVALAQGDVEKARAVQNGSVVWADTQFRALSQRVDALSKLREMGFPFEFIAEQYGLEPHEVERVLAMREKEMADPVMAQLLTSAKSTVSPRPDEVATEPDGAPVVG